MRFHATMGAAALFVLVSMVYAGFARIDDRLADTSSQPSPHVVTNSLGMKLALIPAGEFVMGSPEGPDELARTFRVYERRRLEQLDDEHPAHRVRITRPFHLGIHEVTVGQFRQFVREAGYTTEPERDDGGWGYNPRTQAIEGRHREYSWRNPGFPQGDDHPVVNVTWSDAVAFCKWLSKKEGKIYRLPTEAEWEYACRAGTATRYSSGDDPESLAEVANVFDAWGEKAFPDCVRYALKVSDGYTFTAPVGRLKPNRFGLYDMHGNVWEWCADWYGEDYYQSSPRDDPRGPTEGHIRVRRGGAWHSWALYTRSAFRNYNLPDSRYANLGLRVVREEDQK
jgi:sulfatase modifying factor 1